MDVVHGETERNIVLAVAKQIVCKTFTERLVKMEMR